MLWLILSIFVWSYISLICAFIFVISFPLILLIYSLALFFFFPSSSSEYASGAF